MKIIFKRKRAVQAIVLAVTLCAGCGEKADYEKRLLEEREKHQEEIARVRAEHAAEIKRYKEKLRLYDAEVDSTRRKPSFAAGGAAEGAAGADTQALAKEAGGSEEPKDEAVPPGEEADEAAEKVENVPPEDMEYLLEWFAYSYAPNVEAGKREQFKEDFEEYIEGVREQATDEPADEKKDRMLDSLRERIAETSDEEERDLLEDRVAKIENASEDDLAGVIDYYQRLDNLQDLNELMEEYNISRQELLEAGIDPPPRGRWGPDVHEIAYNLNNFVDRYEPLTDVGAREQYRSDFENCIAGLTAKLTDEELFIRRDQMLTEMEQRLQTSTDREKRWIERRRRWLESDDMDRVRRILQMENLRELGQLAEKYDIPASEMSQSGVWLPRGFRRRD